MVKFVLGLVTGFFGAFGVLLVARAQSKHGVLYRLLGIEKDIQQATLAAEKRAAQRFQRIVKKVVGDVVKMLGEQSKVQQDKMLAVSTMALSILNMDGMTNSRNFTFWQRRTAQLQSEIEKLRP